MKRLHYRLSLVTLAIVVALGSAFYAIDRYSVKLYYEELSQRLNASLAMYIVNAEPLITDGIVNRSALSELASRAMVINPTAEIYLVAPDGRILGHAIRPEDVRLDRIDVAPVRALLSASRPLPIKGDDPRNPGTRKVFSAFPVSDAGNGPKEAGYLYVVLGGSQYAAAAAAVAGSDRQRMIAASMILLVLGASVAALLLFSLLTRRLRRLTSDVAAFSAGRPDGIDGIAPPDAPGDEIDLLRDACHDMAETIQRQVETLKQNDRLRRELVTNISHDLRTPLTTMQGYIETLLIKDTSLDAATRKQYLEIARRHAAHLGRLVQDLFELALLDSSQVAPAFEPFSLTELVHDVVQEFGLQAERASVSLTVDPPVRDVNVVADISLIQRVLENLVGNALKYTPEGGRVSISIRPSASAVGISVSDTGLGIAESALPHIFDRFYKAGRGADERDGSMGLGLAIARRILELHGSEIRVTSEERQGTRFQFDLPIGAQAA